jgi:mannose-6-phosphate isomerase-like protein (cupin superfamily)
MNIEGINIEEKFSKILNFWDPKIIARMNDVDIKLVKIQGDFVWHRHEHTDEVFIVMHGRMTIDFRDGSVALGEGELCVVPKDVEHKPRSDDPCHIMLIEPEGTVNTGDAGGEFTVEDDVWI